MPRLLQPAAEAPLRGGLVVSLELWSTSTYESAAETSPLEAFELSEHLDRCRRSRGRLFSALCLSDAVERFLAPRFMTTLLAVVLLGALVVML